MDDNTIVTTGVDDTGNSTMGENLNQSQEATKTFTQDEVNAIVAKRVQQTQKRYEGIDIDEYQQLKQLRERVEEQELMDRKDFDTLIRKTKDKYETELTTLKSQLESIKIDGALIDAASKLRSVAPEKTAKLLRDNVRLDQSGNVVIMDGDSIRYNDAAEPMTVEQLVEEFLSTNTYFRASGPSGTDSTGNAGISTNTGFDLNNLDMTNPEHREIYRKMRREGKI